MRKEETTQLCFEIRKGEKKKKGSQKGRWGRRMKANDAANHQHCLPYTHCAFVVQSVPLKYQLWSGKFLLVDEE